MILAIRRSWVAAASTVGMTLGFSVGSLGVSLGLPYWMALVLDVAVAIPAGWTLSQWWKEHMRG